MKSTETVLFNIIKSGLWDSTYDIPSDFSDWNGLLSFAQHQAVLGLTAKALLSNKVTVAHMPNNVRLKLKSFIVSNVITSNHIDEVLVKVMSAMQANEIHPILLKGIGLAKNYPFPEIRQCGDIDLYVNGSDAEKTYDVLKTITSRIDDREYLTCGKHYTAVCENVEIEIHRHICIHVLKKYKTRFESYAAKGLYQDLQQIEVSGVKVDTPEITFNAYYIFEHAFEHFMTSGVGLRQLCDWMMFLHKNADKIDRDYLHSILIDLDMMKPWQTFGALLVDYLGMPAEEFPFYTSEVKTAKVLNFILADGNFGKNSWYYKSTSRFFLVKKLKSFGWHLYRGAKMLIIFPKQEFRHLFFIVDIALQYIKTHFLSHGR